jgi:hypothetical protein
MELKFTIHRSDNMYAHFEFAPRYIYAYASEEIKMDNPLPASVILSEGTLHHDSIRG